jgi:TolB-like protein/DNA-binding winged helix-turn-helix (wHTH) protein
VDISVSDRGVLAFGRFRLDPQRRVLMHDGVPAKLAPRAFDTLLHLVGNPGRVVEKDELLAAIWGSRLVEEANLSQAIYSVRKTLQCEPDSDRWIVTVPGRGYRFTAEVVRELGTTALPDAADAGPLSHADRSPAMRAAGLAGDARRERWRWWVGIGAVAIALVTAAGIGAWFVVQRRGPAPQVVAAPAPYSVAVLAFSNMTGDPGQEYFSDGLADELISTLSRIDGMQVAARTSAFSFKGSHATVADIARALHVGAVLEGSVSRESGQVRVNVQLINASSGFPFWSRSYDRSLSNILTSQADIAAAVADSLRLKLLGEDLPRLTAGGTHIAAAFDAYLRAKPAAGANDYKGALAAFETAIALDDRFALAHVGRSRALRAILDGDGVDDAGRMARMEDESIAEAERAVTLAPDLGVAHAALGAALEEARFDFQRAAGEIARARELAPSDSTVVASYADLQADLGHAQEATTAAQFAVTLDPLSARQYGALAYALEFARRYDEALVAARHMVALRGQASDYDAYSIGEIQYLLGEPAAALQTCAGGDAWPLLYCRALAYGRAGRQPEAAAALAKLRAALGDAGAMQYVTVYAQWGQADTALTWLQTAWRVRDPGLATMKALPLLDPIRDKAAFRDIAQRMNFPP